ncbi:uncharacterized protein LOC119768871 isoform X1 [Culex quinquefasciatus]|uniref:uncharacterized protein LOC119768871 isoform X1 n=1 Tax=Culex quinquefasciatus TaxID=7176 RepID=UPI0018E39152|nr:uncharacterized protein LOC119768871 isoform X1 [Culex quinquefasciatus]
MGEFVHTFNDIVRFFQRNTRNIPPMSTPDPPRVRLVFLWLSKEFVLLLPPLPQIRRFPAVFASPPICPAAAAPDCAEDKGNMSEPLEDDAVIENDLEQQQLDESAGKRKSMEIPLFVDEELKTEEEVQAKLDLDENEVKIVDASEENVTVNEEVVINQH